MLFLLPSISPSISSTVPSCSPLEACQSSSDASHSSPNWSWPAYNLHLHCYQQNRRTIFVWLLTLAIPQRYPGCQHSCTVAVSKKAPLLARTLFTCSSQCVSYALIRLHLVPALVPGILLKKCIMCQKSFLADRNNFGCFCNYTSISSCSEERFMSTKCAVHTFLSPTRAYFVTL